MHRPIFKLKYIFIYSRLNMKAYKDIINFEIVNKLRQKISLICNNFNELIRPQFIKNRESEFYEVYNNQYRSDISNLIELRNKCQDIVDECNKIMMDMNMYHIKQYYIDQQEINDNRYAEEYKEQQFEEEKESISNNQPVDIPESSSDDMSDEDIW